MEITPKDQMLLAELEKAIRHEMELLPVRNEHSRSSYSRDEIFNTIIGLSALRTDMLTGLANLRIGALKAGIRLSQ